MNHQVLQTEFEKLVQSITAYGNDISQKAIYLDKDFFKDQNEDVVNSIQGPSMSHYKGHVSTSDNFKKTESNSSGNQSTEDKGHSKKSNSNNTPTETSNQNEISAKKSGNVSEALKDIYNVKTPSDIKKTSRRSLIINTIQKKGSVMIKDLTPVIKGCSEKTIQRELATLVDKGIVNKEGERRWSVYSMA